MVAWWVMLIVTWVMGMGCFILGACLGAGSRADRMDEVGRRLRDRDETQSILRQTRGY